MHKNKENLYTRAINKLDNDERSVLLAPFAAINQTYASLAEHSDDPDIQSLREAIKEMEERMAERMKVRWLAADGTEYESRSEYMEAQWKFNPSKIAM